MNAQVAKPRQRMINMMYLVLTAILAINVSQEVLSAFERINKSLESSIINLQKVNTEKIKSVEAKMKIDSLKALPAMEKARTAELLASSLVSDLEKLRLKTIDESGGLDENGSIKRGDNLDVSTRLFVEGDKPQGAELYSKIQDTRTKLLALIDEEERTEFEQSLSLQKEALQSGVKWEQVTFSMMPSIASVAMLNKIKQDVLTAQSQVLDYLFRSIDKDDIKVDKMCAQVFSPSDYILQGNPYKANIMLSAYASTQQPEIFIGSFDSRIKKNPDGTYDKIVSESDLPPLVSASKLTSSAGMGELNMITSTPGEKRYTGVIRVKAPDGKWNFYPFESKYQVAPRAAVASATKMNVLYIGVDNPVEVSAPGIAQRDIVLNLEGEGSVSANSDGTYNVKVNKSGKVKLNIQARVNGTMQKMGEKEYRVKRVPDPKMFLDGRRVAGQVPVSEIKNATFIMAKPDEDFAFQDKFNIEKYTLVIANRSQGTVITEVINGGNISQRSQQALKSVRPNDIVMLDEIFVNGPGGRRKLSSVSFLAR